MINKPRFVFVPSGGLANRMRAVASALSLANKAGRRAEVVWFNDFGLRANFSDIFCPINDSAIELREAGILDKITIDRARSANFYVPRLYYRIAFDGVIEEKEIYGLNSSGFDFVRWLQTHERAYMSSYSRLNCAKDDFQSIILKLFVPVGSVMEKVEGYTSRFSSHTVGLHVRRTDLSASIMHSTDDKFIEIISRILGQDGNTVFFLATDDDAVKSKLCNLFPGKIVTSQSSPSRESVAGIQDAVAEMWALASTDMIYGSYGSSYSEMASIIGGIPLTIVD